MRRFCTKQKSKIQLLDNSSFANVIRTFLITHHSLSGQTKDCYATIDVSKTLVLTKQIVFYITYKKPNHQKFVYQSPFYLQYYMLLTLMIFQATLIVRKHTLNNKRNILFPQYHNMESNTYTRLLELPNEQINAKSPNGTTTAIFRSFTMLQPPYLYEHKRSNLTVFRLKFLRLCYRRRVHTLCSYRSFTQK